MKPSAEFNECALDALLALYTEATPGPLTATKAGGVWKGVPSIDEPHHTRGTPGEGELFSCYNDASTYIDRFCRRLDGEELEQACKQQARSDERAIAAIYTAFPDLQAFARIGLRVQEFLREHRVVLRALARLEHEATDLHDTTPYSAKNARAALEKLIGEFEL